MPACEIDRGGEGHVEALPAALAADGTRGALDSLSTSLDATKRPRAARISSSAQHAPSSAPEASEAAPAALPAIFLLHRGTAGAQESA